MVTIIKKGSSKQEIEALLNKIKSAEGIDAHKYCGTINLEEDAMKIQKKWRDEWQ